MSATTASGSDRGVPEHFDYMVGRGWVFLEYADGSDGEMRVASQDPVDERIYDPSVAIAVQLVRDIERVGYEAFLGLLEDAGYTGAEEPGESDDGDSGNGESAGSESSESDSV